MGRGDDDNKNYATRPDLKTVAVLSGLELVIIFVFKGK